MTEPSQEEILELIWTMEEETKRVEKDSLIKKIPFPTAEEKLNALNISGPIASTSRLENIDSYTAFLMKVPWHGRSERAQTVEEV